ncbi:MAG: hypothetical protein JXQ26_01645 [Tissierellales bacterium]|nr:hypothetical protein [Tissierellales bacterium]
MIYEFMRMMAGSGACQLSDFYNTHQVWFNATIVIIGLIWTNYKRKSKQVSE